VGRLSGAIEAGVAGKIVEEARKPQNQRRITDLLSGLTSKENGGAAGGRGTGRVRDPRTTGRPAPARRGSPRRLPAPGRHGRPACGTSTSVASSTASRTGARLCS